MSNRPPSDVIAAIATAPGRGGIGVVRVSGPHLSDFAESLCGRKPIPRVATLATFKDADASPIDQGLLLYFPAPHSFTGEDVVELHGHGGPVVLHMLLERCVTLGARLAEPGEFSKRGFLNGKMDLAQAEGVADLIDASTHAAVRSAVKSLSGQFSTAVHRLRDALVDLRMLVEASLDFPEEDIDFVEAAGVKARLISLSDDVASLLSKARQGSLLRRGLHVVIAGKPNVGKSSLLNQLAGHDRAIVTELAGTTRDVLRETIQIEGIPLHIVDTAGLRDTHDVVERLGIERTWREISEADVVIRMVDVATGITAADHEIDDRLPDVPVLWVFNKIDAVEGEHARVEPSDIGTRVWLSARTGSGVEALRSALLQIAGWENQGEDVFLARERHVGALRSVERRLRDATMVYGQLDLMAEEMRLAQESLNSITGEFGTDDLLGEIFSRFCIGK